MTRARAGARFTRRVPAPVRRLAAAVACLLTLAGLLAACGGSSTSPDQKVAAAFLAAFARGDAKTAAAQTTDPGAAQPVIAAFYAALQQSTKVKVGGALKITGMTGRTSAAANADFSASWTVDNGAQPWVYTNTLPVAKVPETTGSSTTVWKVTWAPSDLHPKLATGGSISVDRTQPTRADLLDSTGRPIFTPTDVVVVGVVPNQVTDPPGEAATLASNLGISADDIVTDITQALPTRGDQFVQIVTVRRTAYEAVKAAIYDLPGVQFQSSTQLLAPSATFARQLLGTVGPATADLISASHGRLGDGDQTGIGGIQQAMDAQLAGVAGLEVNLINPDGTSGGSLGAFASPKPGTAVQLTLDSALQTAADGALAGVSLPASLVAVQPSTGKILAVANSTAATDDIGLVGQYPPGSTFKIVTATAAFAANSALTPDTPENCPGTTTVDGRTYENENAFDLGQVDLRTAFAKSCNTTFIGLGSGLPTAGLPTAATQYGIGATWSLPVDAYSGSVPIPASPTEQAEDSIGQGKVLMSPLSMAMVAAAAQSGRPIAPSIQLGTQAQPGPALPAATVAALQDMMRAVVTSGTATNLAGLPGNVSGKTGTAEYGTDTPPRAHSWFVGYRGDLALAVFVYDGQNSNVTASNLALSFLQAVPA